MKVYELIKILEKMPSDLDVTYYKCSDLDNNTWESYVSEITQVITKYITRGRVAKRPCKGTSGSKKAIILK